MSSPPPTISSPPLSRPFLDAMSRLANSVAITTTDGIAGKAAITISTLSPVSAEDPPSLLICLHHQTSVAQKIPQNKTFSVNILNDTQQELAQLFAAQIPPPSGKDRFSHTQHLWQQTQSKAWKLQDALVFFDCQVSETLRCQSHLVVIGKVLDIDSSVKPSKPLLYANRSYTMLSKTMLSKTMLSKPMLSEPPVSAT